MSCIFCDIVSRKAEASIVYEDAEHLAFLSLFPNTLGATLVIPKIHYTSYAFSLPDDVLSKLILCTKKVALMLDQKLGVGRTAMVFEGFGVNHIHAKLFPLHGTSALTPWEPKFANETVYFKEYQGFISTQDGPIASRTELDSLAAKIKS